MKPSITLLLSLCLFLLMGLPLMGQQELWLRDSVYLDRGVPETTNFDNIIRVYFEEYNPDGQALEIISQMQNDLAEWENWRRRIFTYEDGNPTLILIQYWNVNSDQWEDAKERSFSYDAMGNVMTKTVRKASGAGMPLENNRKWTYSYDGQGNQTFTLYQEWTGSEWADVSRQTWTYNAQDLVEEQIMQLWDGVGWINTDRRIWGYDPNNGLLADVTIQEWDDSSQEWINVSRKEYMNTNAVTWSGVRELVWDPVEETWINLQQELFTFTGFQQLEYRLVQQWENDSWENTYRLNYSLESDVATAFGETWNTDSEDWGPFARHQFFFEDQNRVVLEQGWQFWNSDQEMWENDTLSFRRTHFWSEMVLSTAETEIPQSCFLPNPFHSGSTFYCDALPANEQMELRLFSLDGQLVYRSALIGSGPHQIKMQAPAGMYILQIKGNHQVYHLQKLIITNE